MLVKNTIIALMAVAPALSIPVPAAVKSASTVATTKATVGTKATAANPTAQRVSKASVTKAESRVDRDLTTEKSLKAQLKSADSRLITDAASARKLEKSELSQEKADKAAKATRNAALKTTGSLKTHMTPGSKLSTKLSTHKTPGSKLSSKLSTHKTPGSKLSTKLSTKHHSKTNDLTSQGLQRNRHNLRIDTTGRTHQHSSNGLRTPGSSKLTGVSTPGSSRRTGHSVTTPGSAPRTSRLTGQGVTTPSTGFPNALGTGQSQYGFSGPQTGFQSPSFSGRFRGMSENIDYTPTTGGGYRERISWGEPGSAKRLARRALTPTTPTTPTTPVSPPVSPLATFLQKHRAQKSSKVHQHTISETMQLSKMLVEAEKVVNGLEEQMNKPHTVFHNLKRKSALKRLTVPKTPVTTPATPATPSDVKST